MKQTKNTLQVICPVYNEEDVVEIFYQALSDVLVTLEGCYAWRVMFVVDKSTDNTINVLRSIAQQDKRVQILSLSSRFGHQMSLVAGIDHSDADAIIMMDSDLQHPPSLIPKMLEAFENGNEVVYTVRHEPKDSSVLKRYGSRLFYIIMKWLSEIPLASGEADYRLISRRVATVFRDNIRERNQFLRGLFSWVGFKRTGIQYHPLDRADGISKYNWSRMIRFAAHGIVSFSKKPLQYAVILGLFFSVLGVVFACFAVVEYFINDTIPSGWTSVAVLISLFGGIQLFFMGVIGEYVGAIFDEV